MQEPEADTAERKLALQRAVRDLYRVFGRYPFRPEMEKDPCFPGFCDDTLFRSTQLEKLPAEAFEWYMGKAITTWGDDRDFRHFLPRILELLSLRIEEHDINSRIDLLFLTFKLEDGKWREWPEKEQAAIEGFFLALWRCVLAMLPWPYELGSDVSQFFENLHRIDVSTALFIEAWDADLRSHPMPLPAVVHLASEVWSHVGEGSNEGFACQVQLLSAQSPERRLWQWLLSADLLHWLEEGFFLYENTEYGRDISQAHWILALAHEHLP